MMNDEILKKYFPHLTESQERNFSALLPLYKEWNEKINVISRKDIDFLYERHILHSLGIAKFISFKPKTKVLDIGTGGGFPGIPLAILFPEVSFHLVDSIGKKILVVKEIISALNLKNCTAEKRRVETSPPTPLHPSAPLRAGRRGESATYDFAVSRAVADFSEIVSRVKNYLSEKSFNDLPNGIICLKGGDLEKELKPFEKKVRVFDLPEDAGFEEEFFNGKKIVFLPL